MDVDEAIARLGGVASRKQIIELTSRAQFDRAVRTGTLARVAQGQFASQFAADSLSVAAELKGFLCSVDAAHHLGWEVVGLQDRPHILLRSKKPIPSGAAQRAIVHRGRIGPDDVRGRLTSPDRTLEMCARTLPFPEALAVADSALRHGYSWARLRGLAATAKGPGSRQLRRVAVCADERADNPFESVLRAHCLEIEGLKVVPQRIVTLPGRDVRPDLTDVDLRLVLEADSFEFHGHRAALKADTIRYNALVSAGWTVLRFSYEQVMWEAEQVRKTVAAVVTRLSQSPAS